MRIGGLLLLGAMACCLAQASPFAVTFVGAEIPVGPGTTDTTPAALPDLMAGGALDTLFLKFKIPDFSELTSINSFTVSVSVFDNGDGGGESADIAFALPGTNISLASPAFTTLNHVTGSAPNTYTYALTADEINQVFPTITDGNFRVRIKRDTGDFEVAGGSAAIDGTLSPEPSSLVLLTSGFFVAAGLFRRIRK